MRQKQEHRRCWYHKCRAWFVVNRKIGDRQVTCGRNECQRARHSAKCKEFHKRNRGASNNHYEDVVKPFRERNPSYQRIWRLVRSLREIREKIRADLCRLQRLCARATVVTRSGVPEGAKRRKTTKDFVKRTTAMAEELLSRVGNVETIFQVGG